MAWLEQKIVSGPLTLDAVEYQFDVDGHKLYRIKPDKDEMLRRYLLGLERQLIKFMLPLIMRRIRYARTNRK